MQVISGRLEVNELQVESGDGLSISEESSISIKATEDSEFILFDLN